MTAPFSVGNSFSYGWKEVTGRLGFWLSVMLAFAAAAVGPDLVAGALGEAGRPVGIMISLLGVLLQALVQVGLIDLALRAVDGRELRVGQLFARTDILLRYFVASLLFGVGVFLGLVFLVVPGVIVIVFFFFYGHEIASDDVGIGAAFERSMDRTKGRRLEIFLLFVLVLAINVAGALALVVGLFLTVPIAAVATAHAYRTLQATAIPLEDQGLSP